MASIFTDTKILYGDCRDVLKTLPDNSVNCCITSPPYWGLRDYGVDGQIGLEKSPEEYVAQMVAVFHEVKRVLCEDGTCWLNLGDSYAGHNLPGWRPGNENKNKGASNKNGVGYVKGCKPKDIIGIPWRVAFALQADGWFLRQDIIWHKPNPMPESVTDRCTKAHEYVFLLSKSSAYYYDFEAVQEVSLTNEEHEHWTNKEYNQTMLANKQAKGIKGRPSGVAGYCAPGKRNRRSVWTVPTQSCKIAHFATFPPELIRPMIRAGCPVKGTVLDPFGGSGTTGMVCQQEGRYAILVELNKEYIQLQELRTRDKQFTF